MGGRTGNQMKTIRSFVVAIFVVALATDSWGGSNLNLSKSNINRLQNNSLVITASVNLGASESVLIYTAPASGDFMLTQFCASPDATGGIRLDASALGSIAQTTTALSCFTFNPGVSIPKGSNVSCTTNPSGTAAAAAPSALPSSGVFFCTISGLQAK